MSNTVKKNLVPTSENIKDFNFSAVETTSYDVKCKTSEKTGGRRVFTIKKMGGYDYQKDRVKPDWKVMELSYDIVKDFIIPSYRVEYLANPDSDDLRKRYIPIPNQHLEDVTINAYAVTPTGLWYCRNNYLYYLDAKLGTNIIIGSAKNVAELELMPNGMLKATIFSDVEQTVKNRSENYYNSFDQDDYTNYIDEYEVTYKTSTIDPSRYTKYVTGGTATFPCTKCDALLYSGMDFCPQCGKSFKNTNKLNFLYNHEIKKFSASPNMQPEGSEHYFRIKERDDYSYEGDSYSFEALETDPGHVDYSIYYDVAYDDSSKLMYYITDGKYLFSSTIDEKNKKVLYKLPDGFNGSKLVVNSNGIFIVSKETDSTSIVWLTKDGKEVKTIRLPGYIKQTYICGDLLFYICTQGENKHDTGSAYYMSMRNEEEICILKAEKETIRKGIKSASSGTGNNKGIYAEQVFGNELGAVVKISSWYFDDDDSVPNEQVRQTEAEGWYYLGYEELTLECITAPEAGSYLLYSEPNEYDSWIERCREAEVPCEGFSIVGFDMARNLMWVSMKKNGRACRAPMNITTDPQNRLRPDLPIWYEPKELGSNHPGTLYGERTYFDGKLCYVSTSRNFYSMNRAGECEDWPIREYPSRIEGFSVQGGQVFAAGLLLLDKMGISVPAEMKDTIDHECSALRFPATHKFEKILGYSFYGHDSVFRHDRLEEEKRLIKEFDGDKTAATTPVAVDDSPKIINRDGFSPKKENNKPEETVSSAQTVAAANAAGEPSSKLEYWESFAEYAANAVDPGMNLPQAADRNWYAIRLGSAKLRIECTLNSRAQTIKAAFYIKESPEMFAKLKSAETAISNALQTLGTVTWDESSKSANVGVSTSQTGKSVRDQYEWFCEAANLLYKVIKPYLGI